MQLVLDVSALRIFRAQKLAARRHVVEKRANFHLGAGGFAAVADDVDLAAIDHDLSPRDCVLLASRQAKTRYAGNARQGFAAKTERADCFQIRDRSDLAGGMSL